MSLGESSDAEFEAPAIAAVAEWRHLPPIVGGKRVRRAGVQTIIRFALEGGPPPADPPRDEPLEKARREREAYSAGLVTALDRLAADDRRGTELELDELQALYGREHVDLWTFYGYLYTVGGDYARAIDAYETAVGVAERLSRPPSAPYLSLAKLYFARHQYDMSVKTLWRLREATSRPAPGGGARRLNAEAQAPLERLAALGVTEETL